MTVQSEETAPIARPFRWLANQPYLLLSLTSLFWAGNSIAGHGVAELVPPVTLSVLRWGIALAIVLPFAWPHLKRDWSVIRRHMGWLLILSFAGISLFNTLHYWALKYTHALNVLLLQSAAPLFIAIWALILFGARLTLAQAGGILVSMAGVLTILLHGDFSRLGGIAFNVGDVIFLVALALFGVFTAMSSKRPPIHGLSFLSFTFGAGTLMLLPFLAWEITTQPAMIVNTTSLAAIAYVAIFPSLLSYLCYNRGVQLVGANRSAPFFHLIPVFGSVMAILFLGERMQLFHVIGYVLVLAGVVVAARKQSSSSPADA